MMKRLVIILVVTLVASLVVSLSALAAPLDDEELPPYEDVDETPDVSHLLTTPDALEPSPDEPPDETAGESPEFELHRPFLSTPFEYYTVNEGLQLLIFAVIIVAVLIGIWKGVFE